jgi:hypothetical protein
VDKFMILGKKGERRERKRERGETLSGVIYI